MGIVPCAPANRHGTRIARIGELAMGTFATGDFSKSSTQQFLNEFTDLSRHGYSLNFSVWLMNATGFS